MTARDPEAERMEEAAQLCRCGHPKQVHDGIYGSCREYTGHGRSCTCTWFRGRPA